jgi:hypothetical protein
MSKGRKKTNSIENGHEIKRAPVVIGCCRRNLLDLISTKKFLKEEYK